MGIFIKYIIRNIWKNKLRGFLILFSLMIATLILFLNLVAKDDIIDKYKSMYEESYKGYDVIISHKETEQPFFKESDFDAKNVSINSKLTAITTFGVVDNDEDVLTIKMYGCNRKSYIDTGLFVISEGQNFDNNKDDQILISPQLAKNYGYKLGDIISIQTQVGLKKYEIAAIAREMGLFLSVENENLIAMTDTEVETIVGQKDKSNLLMISLTDKTNIKDSVRTFEKNNDKFTTSALVDQETMDFNTNMISQILLLILVLVIFMNYYVISSNAKMILMSRISVVGTFRSLGASKSKVNLILVLENLFYGFLGGMLGVLCGIYFRELILGILVQGISNIELNQTLVPINYTYILIALAFAIIIQLTSVINVIFKTSNFPIKNLIFEKSSSIQKVSTILTTLGVVMLGLSCVLYIINNIYNSTLSILALIFAMCGGLCALPFITKYFSLFIAQVNKLIFGAAPALGARNISYSKIINSNVKLVVISLSVVLMIFITSLSLQGMFVKAKDVFESEIQVYGMEKNEEEYSQLKKVDGVKSLQFMYTFTDSLTVNGNEMSLILCGFQGEGFGVENKQGKIENLNFNEVMMDEFYAIKNGFNIGDQLEIEADSMKTKKIKVKIVGTVNSSVFTISRNTILFSKEQFKKDVTDIPSTIYVSTDKDLVQMKKTLYKELSGQNITVETIDEFIKTQELRVGGLISTIWIFLTLSILMAAIGLINNQVIGFIQRKHEYAILYSVSMSKAQLNSMILFEIVNSFFIGCVVGLSLSIWMSMLLERLLSSIGVYLKFDFQWANILMVVGIIFVTLLLTAIVPIIKILRMNVVQQIKYE